MSLFVDLNHIQWIYVSFGDFCHMASGGGMKVEETGMQVLNP